MLLRAADARRIELLVAAAEQEYPWFARLPERDALGRMVAVRVAWRGALAFLSWQDGAGRDRRLALWPDVLDPATRRELRLVMAARVAVRIAGPVAP